MIKISALPAAGSLTGTELVPVVKSGVTSQTTTQEMANLGATAANLATTIHAATSKVTPVDADELPLSDSAASYGLKKLLWSNIKATLKTYFDGLYTPLSASGASAINNFRLTLTSGTPVTTVDVTSAGTIYACPYNGNQISLYTGGTWVTRSSAQFSRALSALTSGKPYDVFCYDNAGTPTLEFLVWTNDTTRATALAYQDGVLVKSGDATRRYLGTFYTTSTTTTEDSAANRYLWNYYNRVARKMLRRESTASWTYTTATIRQANAAAANQLNFVVGVAEDEVDAQLNVVCSNSSANSFGAVFIGLDVTNASAADSTNTANSTVAGGYQNASATYLGVPGVGKHYLAWLEYASAVGTMTWFGNTTGAYSGLTGRVLA